MIPGTPVEWLVLFFALAVGAGVLLRGRVLEKRIAALERSLGAFAGLGGGSSGPAGDEEILEHLLAINDSLLREIRTADGSSKRSEGS